MESELQDEAEGSRSKRPRCEPVQAELVAESSNFVLEQIKALYVANHEFGDDVVRRTTTIVGLANGLQLLLEDCKVQARQDDEAYKSTRGLADAQPRGLCFVHNNKKDELLGVLRGLRKFGDQKDIPALFGRGAEAQVVRWVYTEKANGENAKIAAIRPQGHVVWLVASKNVTMALGADTYDVDLENPVYADKRFTMARKIAAYWRASLAAMGADRVRDMVDMLTATSATLVAEVLSPETQHIVDYSHLGDDLAPRRLQFYAVVDHRRLDDGATMCSPEEARELFAAWGLQPVAMTTVLRGSTEHAAADLDAQTRANSEGSVVYGLDGKGRCVCMYKRKNTEYIYWRAAREQMRTRVSRERFLHKLRHRMPEPHPRLDAFLAKAETLYAYVAYRAHVLRDLAWDTVFVRWCDLARECADAPVSQIQAAKEWFVEQDTLAVSANGNAPALCSIILVGLPGMGKSLIGRALSELAGLVWVNQDELGSKPQRYQGAITEALSRGKGVVADKVHHSQKVRSDTRNALGLGGKLVYVIFAHPLDGPDSTTHAAGLARRRVRLRGLGHRTLFEGPGLNKAMAVFTRDWEALTPDELAEAELVIHIDPRQPPDQSLRTLITSLVEAEVLDGLGAATEARINEALAHARAAEEEVAAQFGTEARTRYWALHYDEHEQARLWARLEPLWQDRYPSLERLADAHTTLLYLAADPAPDMGAHDAAYRHYEGAGIDVTMTSVVCDGQAMAGIVDVPAGLGLPYVQDFPHITLAIGRDADGRRHPANHALEMLSAGQGTVIPLDPPVTLKGVVSRHYWEPGPKRGRAQKQ